MLNLKKLIADNRGIAAVEMGFLLCMITLGIVSAVTGLGEETGLSLNTTAEKVAAATQAARGSN